MQLHWFLSHETHCGAVLLSPRSRTSAASLAYIRGLRCDLGGSAQIELDLPEEAARKFNDERPLQECCHPVSCRWWDRYLQRACRKSIFFRAAFSLNLGRVIGPAAPDLDTQALGELWQDVPSIDGVYNFEIATVLPFYLPDFEGKPEFAIGLPDSELIFSSRMIRCFYSEEGNNPCPLQYYLCHRLAVNNLQDQKRLTHIHPVPLRTFVSKRVSARCRSAESAVQEHFYSWINELIITLSHVLDAIRATSKGTAKHLLPQSATPSLPVFWICVIGDNNCIKAEQFGVDLPSSGFRSLDSLDQESVNRVHELVANNTAISTHESSLALARTYLYYGYDGLAIVQICIACEAVLAQIFFLS